MPTSWKVSCLIRSACLVVGIRLLIDAIDASLPGVSTLDSWAAWAPTAGTVAAAVMTASVAMRFMLNMVLSLSRVGGCRRV